MHRLTWPKQKLTQAVVLLLGGFCKTSRENVDLVPLCLFFLLQSGLSTLDQSLGGVTSARFLWDNSVSCLVFPVPCIQPVVRLIADTEAWVASYRFHVLCSSVGSGIFPVFFLCSLLLSPVLVSVSLLFLVSWGAALGLLFLSVLCTWSMWFFFIVHVVSSVISAVFLAPCSFSFSALFFHAKLGAFLFPRVF